MKKLLFALLTPFWILFFILVLIHELGHILAGILLGFPVAGLEIGHFPFRTFRFFGFTFYIGDFPRGGRTVLSFTNRRFERWQNIVFLSSGIIVEFLFFLALFLIARGNEWGRILLAIFFIEELWVNIIPSYEKEQPANDGAHLLEIFFPKKILRNRLRAR